MKSLSTKHGPDELLPTAVLRVLWVILMACAAFAVLSGLPVAAEPGPSQDSSVVPVQPEPTLWAEVYATISHLADAGSIPASRLALQMYRFGPILYGMSFAASDRQLHCWQWQVECGRCDPCVDFA